MNGKGSRFLLGMASILLAVWSVSGVAHEARDKASGCLKKVDWAASAFGAQDDPDEIFISAEAFDQLAGCVTQAAGSTGGTPGRIVHRGFTYVRSPAFPGACDGLKADAVRYALCTGARGPSTHDPKLIGCVNEYCDFSMADTRRRFGGL
ncbi:MAG TPA: hypothetical protein VM621_03055 [Luteibacter sp.]|uniref:hypothetical protein n=1 Tax=Luteibacter sp. TaxID=1886636 RepID=UPI002CC79C74|nr:hypothetical protein [Luteibacter sp.]HVI54015.1 hypothetical protein [Luteibacter sp.]